VTSPPLLVGEQLTCVRERRRLFRHLDVQIDVGQALYLEGANGAGKTSLLRILSGLSEPRAGTVYWCGEDIRDCRLSYYTQLLYLGHNPALKNDLTALENLQFYAQLSRHQGDAEHALAHLGLRGHEDQPIRTLSAGQRRRVALARLWLSTARLWLLDEPFTALDRTGVEHLQQRMAAHLAADGAIVVTSHQAIDLPRLTRLNLS